MRCILNKQVGRLSRFGYVSLERKEVKGGIMAGNM